MSTGLITTEPIDYLVVGHVPQDITPTGLMMGGTVTYAALTAQALGYKVGIVTSARDDLDLNPLNGIPVHLIPAEYSTTFKNQPTPFGRQQYLYHTAKTLAAGDIPVAWQTAPIIHAHLGHIADIVRQARAVRQAREVRELDATATT